MSESIWQPATAMFNSQTPPLCVKADDSKTVHLVAQQETSSMIFLHAILTVDNILRA
jgi:hypothetical protein